MICEHEECGRPQKSRGFCNRHYESRRLRGLFADIAPFENHGMRKTREYTTWCHIKARCFNPLCKQFPQYGGRGITVHGKWADSFAAFYDYMGDSPSPSHSIDRIDGNGNYEPGNVRWATPRQQANNRHNVEKIAFKGRTGSLAQHCRWHGLVYGTLKWRRLHGWDALEALEFYTKEDRKRKTRCRWCKKFLAFKTMKATIAYPDIFYCPKCFKKGVGMEEEAMGLYDPRYMYD